MRKDFTPEEKIEIISYVKKWGFNYITRRSLLYLTNRCADEASLEDLYNSFIEEGIRNNYTEENILEYYNKIIMDQLESNFVYYTNRVLFGGEVTEEELKKEREIEEAKKKKIKDDTIETIYNLDSDDYKAEKRFLSFKSYSENCLLEIIENPEFHQIMKKIEHKEGNGIEGNWYEDLLLILMEVRELLVGYKEEYIGLTYYINWINSRTAKRYIGNNIYHYFRAFNAFTGQDDLTNMCKSMVTIMRKFNDYYRKY